LGITLDMTQVKTFSILERIDVGETTFRLAQLLALDDLSVSSNGSTWVKLHTRTQ